MGLIKYKIGELIELVQEINSELKYGPDDVRGMTITKEIIPTKADVSGTDLSKFLVVHPREFIYNPRTHGKRIGFGYNNSKENFIISWNNIAFRVKKSMENIVLADYLFLHFKRDEWDREACFQSWGSSTEVFSWESLCDMTVDLPNIYNEKKYVDIYNTMLKNQGNYENGLNDLKLSFEVLIDKYKHKSKKKKISEVFKEVDCRNINSEIKDVQGINITKQFMPSVANINGVDLSKYKIVRKGQFVFSGMQTGRDKCIRIALFDKDEPVIISPAYTVLEIKDNSVLVEYIMMWFLRKEVDRLGWFMSDGSIRTNLDMDRFYEIEIPVPDLNVQKSIVQIYNAYNERRDINEKLKEQIKDICPILIKGSIEEARKAKEA